MHAIVYTLGLLIHYMAFYISFVVCAAAAIVVIAAIIFAFLYVVWQCCRLFFWVFHHG